MKNALLAGVALSVLLGIGTAVAQRTLPTPVATANVGPMDQNTLVNVIPGGVGGVPSKYTYAGTVGGTVRYQYLVPVTGFSITPADTTTFLLLNPAGTLAEGTLTMPAHPSDGQRFCYASTQTQTALTVAANTGQSLGGASAPTAGVANTLYCLTYIGSTATWYYIPGV